MIRPYQQPQGSPPLTLSASDWKKIGIGAGLAVAGALAAYFTSDVVPVLEGENTLPALLLAATFSAGINVVRKWLLDTQK